MYTTALYPINLIPWRDSNPGLLVPEADEMSTHAVMQTKALQSVCKHIKPFTLAELELTIF
jgi:hypothetical protein